MKKIHKLLYSCFGFFMTLAYRNDADGAIVCTYSALSSCSNTGSTWYDSVATARTAMLNNTGCAVWKNNTLCASGSFVASCYTDSNKTTRLPESKWDTDCSSSAQVDCSSCSNLMAGAQMYEPSSSVAVVCSSSNAYTFQLCSSYQIDASGNPFAYGTTRQRSYTCTQTFSNSATRTIIKRNTDCFVPAGQVVGDVSSGMPTYDFLESCYYTN